MSNIIECSKICARKSIKNGYRYIWDEDTKFIIYQNNEGDIIIGTINHEEKIKEEEIETIYKLSVSDFGIFPMGSGVYINYTASIYLKNLLKLANKEKVDKLLMNLFKYNDYLSAKNCLVRKEEKYTYNEKIDIYSCYSDGRKYPEYWKLENDNGKNTAKTINHIILEILCWFYDIGRTRTTINNDNEIIEDYNNDHLFEVIDRDFSQNYFKVIEESRFEIDEIYEQAQLDNENYDRIIKNLNQFIKKIHDDLSSEEIKTASRNAMQYYKIVGKNYSFHDNIYKEIPGKKLELIKKEK